MEEVGAADDSELAVLGFGTAVLWLIELGEAGRGEVGHGSGVCVGTFLL